MQGIGNPIQQPFTVPSPLAAPRAQAPPSAIPTDQLANQADHWITRSPPQVVTPQAQTPYQYQQQQPSIMGYNAVNQMVQQGQGQGLGQGGWGDNRRQTSYAQPQAQALGHGYGGGGSSMNVRPNSYAGPPTGPYGGASQSIGPGSIYPSAGGGGAGGVGGGAVGGGGYGGALLQHAQTYTGYGPLPPPPPPQQFQQQQQYQQQPPPPPPPIIPQLPPAQAYYPAPMALQMAPPQQPPPPLQQQSPPQHQASLQQQQQQQRHSRVQSSYSPPQPQSQSQDLPSLDQLSLGPPSRKNYYATPEDGPPYKLAVVYPDQKMLASMRETAYATGTGMNGSTNGGGSGGVMQEMSRKVAWGKQVLKFIERHQSTAGESSRINDPTLVRWTDEALNHILTSAASSTPVPLALYLRGDLSSSGSFPSYRQKDSKLAFRDFEASANSGYEKAWFRIGRAYEDFGDVRRAVGAYEKGVEKGDCGSTYRLAMAYLLGQIGVTRDDQKAIALLRRAADTADLDTPQPPYILGMLLSGEFESPTVQISKDIVPKDIDEAKWRIERAAYLSFGPAQYKMGFSYEYATLGCLFDPLLSVQYYALASQNGEVEADMALSKWYLCGSEGNFDKNEQLAVTFAEKAASKSLPSAEFALGYFREVGINGTTDIIQAKRWYTRAASHGNQDAKDRLDALATSETNVLSRTDHEQHVDTKLVRKRTQAKLRSDEQREKMEASNLAASLGGSTSGPRPPKQPLPQPPQQSQYQPQAPSSQQQQRLPPQQLQQQQDFNRLRRRDTVKQVEAAAAMSPGRMTPSRRPISQGPSPSPNSQYAQLPPQQQLNQSTGGRQQGYQLSDRPMPQSASSSSLSQSQGAKVRPQQQEQEIRVQRPNVDTFAAMGIPTQKAKNNDCIIM